METAIAIAMLVVLWITGMAVVGRIGEDYPPMDRTTATTLLTVCLVFGMGVIYLWRH